MARLLRGLNSAGVWLAKLGAADGSGGGPQPGEVAAPAGRFVWVKRSDGSWDEFLVLFQHPQVPAAWLSYTSSDDRSEVYGFRWVLLMPPHFRVGVGVGTARQLPQGHPVVSRDRANWIWDFGRDRPWAPTSPEALQALTGEAAFTAAAMTDSRSPRWVAAGLLGPTAGPLDAFDDPSAIGAPGAGAGAAGIGTAPELPVAAAVSGGGGA